jgi:hypothetical protein
MSPLFFYNLQVLLALKARQHTFWPKKEKLKISKVIKKKKNYGNQRKNLQNLFNQHKC